MKQIIDEWNIIYKSYSNFGKIKFVQGNILGHILKKTKQNKNSLEIMR